MNTVLETQQHANKSTKVCVSLFPFRAKKSKIALLKLSHEQSESSDSATEHLETNTGIVFTSSKTNEPCETEQNNVENNRTVIDLEIKEPEGLMEVV